jgi:hypothetical protein
LQSQPPKRYTASMKLRNRNFLNSLSHHQRVKLQGWEGKFTFQHQTGKKAASIRSKNAKFN